MPLKAELRKKYKQIRRNIPDKSAADAAVCRLLCDSEYVKAHGTILFYAALPDEVNVDSAAEYYISQGKRVAFPYCIDNNGKMQYYYIESLNDLKAGTFGVREPDISRCALVEDYDGALCVVPAIAYDRQGYRLGYGKGYYDRFLAAHSVAAIGVCYKQTLTDALPYGEYDLPVEYIAVQSGIVKALQGGNNG